jgi:hypothetical protein
MVQFKGSLTESPSFNTGNPTGSLMRWGKWMIGTAAMFVGLGVASQVIAPKINSLLSRATGGRVSSGDSVEVRF